MTSPPSTRWWVRGIPIGKFLGIPILIAPSWVLSIFVVMYIGAPVVTDLIPDTDPVESYLIAAILGILLGFSVLLHELGHCIAARRLDVPVRSVQLYLLGGMSEIGRLPRSPGEEAQVAAAGPLASVVLTGLFTGLTFTAAPHTVGWLLLIQLAFANGLIAVFNLIPALPLDGGRVLRAGVWRLTGRRGSGTGAAVIGGYLVALALLVWAAFLFTGGTRTTLLQGTIGIAMALFVGLGAFAEREVRRVDPDRPFAIADYAQPCVEIPAGTPVAEALRMGGAAEIALTGEHGNIIGVLDRSTAQSLQVRSPWVAAIAAAQPINPEHVILFSDTAQEVMDVVRAADAEYFLLIGSEGESIGVLRRTDMGGAAETR